MPVDLADVTRRADIVDALAFPRQAGISVDRLMQPVRRIVLACAGKEHSDRLNDQRIAVTDRAQCFGPTMSPKIDGVAQRRGSTDS